MVPLATLVLALSAKRPNPPPVSGLTPDHCKVSRSEAESAVSTPSIFKVGRVLQFPSKANLSGAPVRRTFNPDLSPARAAAKSINVSEASIGSPCHVTWPVAAKLLEIDGQASARSTFSKVSLISRAASSTTMVPPSIRISENEAVLAGRPALEFAGRGPKARASESTRAVQFEWPLPSKLTLMCGRTRDTSAISMRPASNGKKRSRAVS